MRPPLHVPSQCAPAHHTSKYEEPSSATWKNQSEAGEQAVSEKRPTVHTDTAKTTGTRQHTSRAGRSPVPASGGRRAASRPGAPAEAVPAASAIAPAAEGPAAAPTSPASASMANMAPPPAGKRAAAREVAPGHMRATHSPVSAQATRLAAGAGDDAVTT